MDRLFRGYIELKGKKAIEKFKNREEFKTYEQVSKLDGFAGILASDVILIDIDDYDTSEILMRIVEDLQLQCRVYETTRGKHFYFKNTSVESCHTHVMLALGIEADIKVGCKNSYDALKVDGKKREIIFDKDEAEDIDYDPIPKWLLPIKFGVDFNGMEAGEGRNQAFFNYILKLQREGFTKEEIKECISLINKYVLAEPLEEHELEVILRDDAFKKPVFMDGRTFLFDKFAQFLINNNHIIKINGQLHIYREGVYVNGYKLIESEMIKYIPNLNKQKRTEVLNYLDILITDNTPMSDAKYIAFKNGVYDIETDEFLPFTPELVIRNKINCNYNPDAYSELTEKMLNKIACNDIEVRMLLEECVGYCFYRRNELRKAFIFTGEKSNGKSTYIDMISTLLGNENTSALDLHELDSAFKTADIEGKLANLGDDIGDEFISNAAIFKKLVSGDRIVAERKFQDPFEFNNYAKLIFSANNMPRIKDKSGAVISRLVIIPFNAKFSPTDEDFDPYIKYKLRLPENLEYLLVLGIKGLKRVLANQKFTTSSKATKELKEYEENNNPIILFFNENSISDVVGQVTRDLYMKYDLYCSEGKYQALSIIEFSKQVKKYYNVEIVDKTIKGKRYRIFAKK